MDQNTNIRLFGVGLYTAAEASRLIGVPLARIRRWLHGHHSTARDGLRSSEPLWSPEIPAFNDRLHLGFRDLVELRIVDRFRSVGLSLQQLRRAHRIGQALLSEERPFSTAAFKTDGRRLYLEIARQTGEADLVDLLTRQHSFHTVVAPSLRSLDFDQNAASRWWPEIGAKVIVLDPLRSFGKPIVASSGIPADVLADAYVAEGSYARAASMFGSTARDVRISAVFQQKLAA